jgi:hypothetical protein
MLFASAVEGTITAERVVVGLFPMTVAPLGVIVSNVGR